MIDDHALATKRFTASYLFSLNRCRQLAIDDPSNITTAEYWQRHRAARNEFNEVNDETKELWKLRSREHIHRQSQIA